MNIKLFFIISLSFTLLSCSTKVLDINLINESEITFSNTLTSLSSDNMLFYLIDTSKQSEFTDEFLLQTLLKLRIAKEAAEISNSPWEYAVIPSKKRG